MTHFSPSPYRATQTFRPFWVCRERISLKKAVFRAATQAKHPFQSVSWESRINGVSRNEDMNHFAPSPHRATQTFWPFWVCRERISLKKAVFRAATQAKHAFQSVSWGSKINGVSRGIENQWCAAKQGHELLSPIALSHDTGFLAILGVSREDFLEKRRFFPQRHRQNTRFRVCRGDRGSMVCRGKSKINGVSRNKDMNHFSPSPHRATQTFRPFWVCRERISLKKGGFPAATQAKHPFQGVSRESRINGVSRGIEDQWCVTGIWGMAQRTKNTKKVRNPPHARP